MHDNRRIALYLLNNILGGPGMNARLNVSLRERHALVYTVESMLQSYSDTGLWAVYFGCDPRNVNRCLRLIRRELDKVMEAYRRLDNRRLAESGKGDVRRRVSYKTDYKIGMRFKACL